MSSNDCPVCETIPGMEHWCLNDLAPAVSEGQPKRRSTVMSSDAAPLALNTHGLTPCPADPDARTVQLGHDVAHLAVRAHSYDDGTTEHTVTLHLHPLGHHHDTKPVALEPEQAAEFAMTLTAAARRAHRAEHQAVSCLDCEKLPTAERLVPVISVPGTGRQVCLEHAAQRYCSHGYTLADSCPVCP